MGRGAGLVRGHIRNRGASWSIVYDLQRDPSTGKRRKKWQGGFETRRDAQRALADIISRLDRGSYVEPTKQTLCEYLTQTWLPAARVSRKPSTLVGYRVAIEKHIVPRIGAVPVQRLSAADLNGLYAELLTEGHRQRKAGLSARTVRLVHTVLRKALADAVKWQLLSRNVADAAEPPPASAARADAERRRKWWSAEELACFLGHVREHHLFAAFWLAAMTGMRRGEVLGLRWRDLDFEHARLFVRQSLIAPAYELQFSAPKGGKTRAIDLDPETVALLRAHRVHQAQQRLASGPGYEQSDLVFRNADGSPIVPQLFSLAFAGQVKAAGLPKIRLHDLRHTHATLLGLNGEHPKVVQERLGHHSPGFTLEYYTHAFPSQQREAAQRFATLVETSGGPPLSR